MPRSLTMPKSREPIPPGESSRKSTAFHLGSLNSSLRRRSESIAFGIAPLQTAVAALLRIQRCV